MAKLIDHCCMVITKKQNQAVIEKTLKSLGISNILMPQSFHEANELALQELPHIFLLESDLPDCSTMTLLKKIKDDKVFEKAIFVVVRKFSREEILVCVELKVSAMLQQPLDPNALQAKLKALVAGLKGQSPYKVDAAQLPGGMNLAVKIPGKISSTQGEFFTAEAGIEIPNGKQITLRPSDQSKAPVRVTSAGTTEADPSRPQVRSILFSFESAAGKGREWLLQLKSTTPPAKEKRCVLIMETNAQRGKQFVEMLSFYDIDATHVPSFEKLRLVHEGNKQKYRVIYLCEPPIHASGISWDKYATALRAQDRPVQLVATTSHSPAAKAGVVWMSMPFGLDVLVERFEGAFAQLQADDQGARSAGAEKVSDMGLSISFFADLNSVDENGALFESPYNLPLNSRIQLTHPSLAIIDLTKNVRVAAAKVLDAAGAKFRIRLSNQDGKSSRGRYWKQVVEKLAPILLDVPEAASDTKKKTA
jgi:DNA-binding response OmpR family regulator